MAPHTTNTHDGTIAVASGRPAGYRRPLAPRRRFFDSAEHLEEPEQLPIAWKELIQQLSAAMPRGPAGSAAGSTATTSVSSSRRNSYGLSASPVASGLHNPNNSPSMAAPLFGTLPLPYNSAPSTLRRSCSNLGA